MSAVSLSIIKGDVQVITCTIYENGTVKNLTGYNARMYIADQKDEESDISVDGVISDPALGIAVFTITHDVTKDFIQNKYYYEMKIYTAEKTDVKTFQTGEINVSKAINAEVS